MSSREFFNQGINESHKTPFERKFPKNPDSVAWVDGLDDLPDEVFESGITDDLKTPFERNFPKNPDSVSWVRGLRRSIARGESAAPTLTDERQGDAVDQEQPSPTGTRAEGELPTPPDYHPET